MYGYIYKITNLINGKIYVGKRVKPQFDKYYWGSGLIIKAAIKKYGKENFKRELIQECFNDEELNICERFWIKSLQANNPDIGYNITDGGTGGDTAHNYSWYTNGISNLYIKKGEEIPAGFHRGRLMNLSGKGNIWINNGESQHHIRPDQLIDYPDWVLGMLPRGSQWLEHIKEAASKRTEEAKENNRKAIKKYHEEHPHSISSSSFKKGHQTHNKGKICITDGCKNKYITEDSLQTWLEKGWREGSTQRKKTKKV